MTKKEILKNWTVMPGFEIELIATGLDLPANIAFAPKPKKEKGSPLLYIGELYGQVKVLTNDGKIKLYAKNLLNYNPDYSFPGTGESGLTGIAVEPTSGDLFLSMIYYDKDAVKSRVIRTKSLDYFKMDSFSTILENVPSVHAAHQIQAITFGFDKKLYVSFGDGMGDPKVAQNNKDLRGKILRLNLDGSIPSDNPISNSPVFAKGFRNPFGAFWRKSDKSLYISDNGPNNDDRIAKVIPKGNYGWPMSMRQNSIFWWEFTQAPTALAFMQDEQFPDKYNDELFVGLFGHAYRAGRAIKGKKIIKMKLNKNNDGITSYDEFVTYTGEKAGSPCGLAFGPGGLYFTDLHGEKNNPKELKTGNLFRVSPIKDWSSE